MPCLHVAPLAPHVGQGRRNASGLEAARFPQARVLLREEAG